jgi:hypothetical protein
MKSLGLIEVAVCGCILELQTSIRMAQDLGIQKLQGLQLEGRIGPMPKTAKHGLNGKEEEKRREEKNTSGRSQRGCKPIRRMLPQWKIRERVSRSESTPFIAFSS